MTLKIKGVDPRFSSIEREEDGSLVVYNEVTGIVVLETTDSEEAVGVATMLSQHYAGISKKAGWG